MKRAVAIVVVALVAFAAAAQTPEPYSGKISVVRYLVEARVLDVSGNAIRDLRPDELTVTIGKEKAVIESVRWIGADEISMVVSDEGELVPADAIDRGRLFVFLVQTDFGRNSQRVRGQLKFNLFADQMLEILEPDDYLAVLSYDSNLKVRLDFTRDREAARKAIRDSIRIEPLPLPEPSKVGPSIVRHLKHEEMRRAATSEKALLLIANAMAQVEGSKMFVLAGWGLGELRGRRVAMPPAWRAAISSFLQHRTPIMSLGTGAGGQLTFGLVASAKATGGMYGYAAGLFPGQTFQRVKGSLAGYYELTLRTDLAPGQYPLAIRVDRRGATVQAVPQIYVYEDESAATFETAATSEEAPQDSESAADLFRKAMRLLQDGELDGVAQLLDDTIEKDPSFSAAYFERGMIHLARGNPEAAASDLQRYLELEPRGIHARDARDTLATLPKD